MIVLNIPSLDRPAQLDCLLRSLFRYWSVDDVKVNVLYKYSSEKFAEGYDRVFRRHYYVTPILEYDFGRQIKELIEYDNNNVVGFMTDDCVIYRQPDVYPQQIEEVFNNDKVMSFSLRLGVNTYIQNYQNGELQPTLRYTEDDDYIVWKWSHYSGYVNWGYVYSWDGHFYDRKFMLKNVKDRDFNCPRGLEHQLNVTYPMRLYGVEKPYMIACKESSLFVNTINRVQPDGPNAGTKYYYSPEELNDRWLSGQQIALQSFDGLELQSSHEEFPLTWEEQS